MLTLRFSTPNSDELGLIIETKLTGPDCGYIIGEPRFNFTYFEVYVFEDELWKLYTGYHIGDVDGALLMWRYASEEEKQIVGDLRQYIDSYSTCPDF
jgi:hypothetical protein